MRLSFYFIALGLAIAPTVAAAEPISWSRYQVPETGAAVDIPMSIFSEQAGPFTVVVESPTTID